MQLPAFRLAPQLADRQQDSSVNLKPSEVRLSQQSPEEPGDPAQPRRSEPALRGILKKSRSGSWEGSGTDASPGDAASCREQNGGGCEQTPAEDRMESQVLPVPPRRQRRSAPGGDGGSLAAAPWRQRARTRRENPPGRSSEEQETPQDRRDKPLEQLVPPVEHKRAAQ